MNKQNGAALVSILALTSLALLVISSTTVVSVINARINLNYFQSQKAYRAANYLTDEVIISFIRERTYNNLYADWTNDCLQIEGFDCKMNVSLTEDGGFVEAWGRWKNKQRRVRADLVVNADETVSVTKEEIY